MVHILDRLRELIAHHAAQDRARTAFLVLVWNVVGRAGTRLANLFARWQAGTLPRPRPRPGRTRKPSAPIPPNRRLPRTAAWLLHHIPPSAVAGNRLASFLARPDFAEFLAAAPQAARILRPLCRMLGTPLPPALQLPPRPPRRRPPRPRPAQPAPAPGAPTGTPPRPLPAYVRAAARAWRSKPA